MPSERLLRLQEEMRRQQVGIDKRASKKAFREQDKESRRRARARWKAKRQKEQLEANRKWAMTPEDPLYGMLPSADKVDLMKWFPRQVGERMDLLRMPQKTPSAYGSQAEYMRSFLYDESKNAVDRKGRTRFEQICQNMFEVATSKAPQAKACAELLLERAFGTAKPSEEELESKKRGGYQIIVMGQPNLKIPSEELAAPKPPEPDFIEADFSEVQ